MDVAIFLKLLGSCSRFGKLCVNIGCFVFLTFQLNFKNCLPPAHPPFRPLPDLQHTPIHFLWAKEVSIPKVFYQTRLLFFWKCCSLDASRAFAKPECGRLVLETLSLSLLSDPCEQFQGLTPWWALVIGRPKKRVLKWKRWAEVLFS